SSARICREPIATHCDGRPIARALDRADQRAPWLPERRHVTSTAVSIERYDSCARCRLSRSDVSNQATASCSSGAALTGVPVHLSINQICMSNVAVRISCIGGLDGSEVVIPY